MIFQRERRESVNVPNLGRWKKLGQVVVLSCPNCGSLLILCPKEYTIGKDGVVLPEIDCLTERCNLKGFVRLSGWIVD